TSSKEPRLQCRSLAHEQCTHTLRRMELMTGNRKQVATDFLHFDRNLGSCLYGIGMKVNISFGTNFANFLNWLHDAGFIVRHHDRNKRGMRGKRGAKNISIDQDA